MAQGRTSALHLGSIMAALSGIRSRFGDAMEPGDVFINNDPYQGGSHLPDIFVLKPIFVGGSLVAFVGGEAHVSDIGGRIAGSNAADSTEIYQGGIADPALAVGRRGAAERDAARSHRGPMCAQPREVLGDVNALLAALSVGERGVLRLIDRYGNSRLRPPHAIEVMEYTEEMGASGKFPAGRTAITTSRIRSMTMASTPGPFPFA